MISIEPCIRRADMIRCALCGDAPCDAACAAMNGMATFEEARIDDGYLDPIRAGDSFRVPGGRS